MVPLNCLSEPELFLLAFGPESSGCILNSSLKEDTTAQNLSFFLSFLICFYTEYGKDCQTEIEKSWRKINAMYESVLFLCPRVSVRIFFSSEKKGISVFSE